MPAAAPIACRRHARAAGQRPSGPPVWHRQRPAHSEHRTWYSGRSGRWGGGWSGAQRWLAGCWGAGRCKRWRHVVLAGGLPRAAHAVSHLLPPHMAHALLSPHTHACSSSGIGWMAPMPPCLCRARIGARLRRAMLRSRMCQSRRCSSTSITRTSTSSTVRLAMQWRQELRGGQLAGTRARVGPVPPLAACLAATGSSAQFHPQAKWPRLSCTSSPKQTPLAAGSPNSAAPPTAWPCLAW